jgi:hypothetical protein
MSKNSKLLKYEVINTKKNKNLIGEIFDFKRVRAKGDLGEGERKPPKSKAPAWFADFRNEVMQRFDKLENRLDKVVKINNLEE